jgi:hypothetical protein
VATYNPPTDRQPTAGLSRTRKALLGVYCAFDERLRHELQYVGLRFPEHLDPVEQLEQAARAHREEQGRPAVHQLQLAFAAMAVLSRPLTPDSAGSLRVVAAELAEPGTTANDDSVGDILAALQAAASAEVRPEERWTYVVNQAGVSLHPDLRKIRRAWCRPELRAVDDEYVSRVETQLVVEDPRDLDQLSLAVLPDNWKTCNDFFCDLVRTPDRDASCPGSTGGQLVPTSSHWRGVYEERVGECPRGWFPDTYLLFTWDRTLNQIILRYELGPRRREDRTVLKVDQGYIQVDRLPDTYQVSTVKYLLFDDQFIPGGGQILGSAACQLGWLDYSVNQFTVCTDALGKVGRGDPIPVDQPSGGLDAGLQEILDRCQAHLQEAASDADKRFTTTVAALRAGRYGLDYFVNDWAGVVRQGIRDGARSLAGQASLARESLDLAEKLTRGGGGSR